MLNSVIIGQYVPGDSFIHKLDPRTKIITIFFYVIIVFFANNAWSYGLLTLFVLLAIIITRIPLRFILKGLTPIWFLIFFTFLLHLFLTKEGPVVFERSEEHTSELQSRGHLVCRLLLEKKDTKRQ